VPHFLWPTVYKTNEMAVQFTSIQFSLHSAQRQFCSAQFISVALYTSLIIVSKYVSWYLSI